MLSRPFFSSPHLFLSLAGCLYRWKPDSDGAYFIDRDPTLFRYIINYMRDEENLEFILGLKGPDEKMIHKELDYYLIQLPVVDPRCSFENQGSPHLRLNEAKTIATKTGVSDEWDAGIRTSAAITRSVKFKVLSRGKTGYVMLGLTPLAKFRVEGSNYYTSGWYIFSSGGALYSQVRGYINFLS